MCLYAQNNYIEPTHPNYPNKWIYQPFIYIRVCRIASNIIWIIWELSWSSWSGCFRFVRNIQETALFICHTFGTGRYKNLTATCCTLWLEFAIRAAGNEARCLSMSCFCCSYKNGVCRISRCSSFWETMDDQGLLLSVSQKTRAAFCGKSDHFLDFASCRYWSFMNLLGRGVQF